ncbi:MAG: glycosyltransferase [Acidobacteria bacterium]|nr:glycosyltransferase [Acidobacteriota bacterium]
MKLIVQIPCHNEADHLAATLAAIPRQVAGVDRVEILVLDDGSDDQTVDVALAHGADAVLQFPRRQGLARVFKAGIDAAIRAGADVIVNTDGDNQYDGSEIPGLVAPILEGRADMVVGDRDPGTLAHFSPAKRLLQRLGSWLMRQLSGTTVADSTSGFRAYTREAALRINVANDFTYTLETLIQAGSRRLRIVDVPIQARHTPRKSRLAPTTFHYLKNAGGTMARAYAMYEPMKVFFYVGGAFLLTAAALGIRFLSFYFGPSAGTGNIQSLILAAILAIVGFQFLSLGLVADLMAANRKLMEEQLYRLRRRDGDDLCTDGVAGLPGVLVREESRDA